MTDQLTILKRIVPGPVKYVAHIPRRLLPRRAGDSEAYWRSRGKGPGQAAVLWQNQEYNLLYRRMQTDNIARHVGELSEGARVLDIGCGVGIVARMTIEQNPHIMVDVVYFEEIWKRLLIDTFLRPNYLARAKFSPRDVERFIALEDLRLIQKSNILFWPFQEWLANSNLTGDRLAKCSSVGELMRERLSRHLWADYKDLMFEKRS